MRWAIPQLVKTYLQHKSHSLMADYLPHLVGRKLTSSFHADDSAGNVPLTQKKKKKSQKVPDLHI
jgi:hypothetical protein